MDKLSEEIINKEKAELNSTKDSIEFTDVSRNFLFKECTFFSQLLMECSPV